MSVNLGELLVSNEDLAARLEMLAKLYAPDADTPTAMLLAASRLRKDIARSEKSNMDEGYPGIAHDLETMRGVLRGVMSLLHRSLNYGLLRAESEAMLRDIEAAINLPSRFDKKQAPMPASDFRLLSEAQKYGAYAEQVRRDGIIPLGGQHSRVTNEQEGSEHHRQVVQNHFERLVSLYSSMRYRTDTSQEGATLTNDAINLAKGAQRLFSSTANVDFDEAFGDLLKRPLPAEVVAAINNGPSGEERLNDEWKRREMFAQRIARLAYAIGTRSASSNHSKED